MHELSIATSVVEIVTGHVRAAGGGRVVGVTLRVGKLASVHEVALRSAFEIATADTPLAEAELRIDLVPVTIFCGPCGGERELPGIGSLACPICGRPSGDIRAGTELDVESIEIEPLDTSPIERPPPMKPALRIDPVENATA